MDLLVFFIVLVTLFQTAGAASCAPGTYASGATADSVVASWVGGGMQGSADGSPGQFYYPKGVAVTSDGAFLYVADDHNHKIRKIETSTGLVSSFTGLAGTRMGSGTDDGSLISAKFNQPHSLALTEDDQFLYVTDGANHRIREIRISDGQVSTLSTDGFGWPWGITVTKDQSTVYVCNEGGKINEIRTSDGHTSILTGSAGSGFMDGSPSVAKFFKPSALALSLDDSVLYVADRYNNKIRLVNTADGETSTAPLSGGLNQPAGLALTANGAFLYVSSHSSHLIAQVSTSSWTVQTLASGIYYPQGLSLSRDQGFLYVGRPQESNFGIGRITLSTTCDSCSSIPEHSTFTEECNWNCVEGYYKQSSTNCALCSSVNNCIGNVVCTNSSDSRCDQCEEGFYLHGYGCNLCSPVTNCAGDVVCSSSSDSQCNKCAEGYYAQGHSCEVCSPVSNCVGNITCSNSSDSQCDKCVEGYYLKNTQCQVCSPVSKCIGNIVCTNSSDSQCDKCGMFHVISTNGQCQETTVSLDEIFSEGKESADKIGTSAVIFANLQKSFSPVVSQMLDQFLLDHDYVVRGGDNDVRCFNSMSALGREFCYNTTIHSPLGFQCNLV